MRFVERESSAADINKPLVERSFSYPKPGESSDFSLGGVSLKINFDKNGQGASVEIPGGLKINEKNSKGLVLYVNGVCLYSGIKEQLIDLKVETIRLDTNTNPCVWIEQYWPVKTKDSDWLLGRVLVLNFEDDETKLVPIIIGSDLKQEEEIVPWDQMPEDW